MAITKDQVFEAANQIAETGETPKLSNVRAKIGRGSNTDLGPFFKEWKEQQKPTEVVATPAEPAPQQVLDLLNEVAPQIWACAAKIANEHLQSERQAMELEKTRLTEALAEANELGDQSEFELEAAKYKIEALTTEATEAAKTAAADLVKQVTARSEAETKAATLSGTVEALTTQIKELNNTIEQLHIEGVKQAERAANAEAKIVDLTDQIETKNVTINQIRIESVKLAERVTISETKNTELINQIKIQTATVDQLRNDSAKLIERATAAETKAEDLVAQIAKQNQQAEQHERTIGELSKEIGKQLERATAADAKSGELAKEISTLKNAVVELKEAKKV
jgi:chromosome segregation ATPase